MSITVEIHSKAYEGDLVLVRPRLPKDRILRRLYVHRGLNEEIKAAMKSKDAEVEDRYAHLLADLHLYVSSQVLPIDFIKPMEDSDGVWEIRSVLPKPSMRIFGVFATKDWFVATHHVERNTLGGKDDADGWNHEFSVAKHCWRTLFPTYNHLNTENLDDVLTE